MASGEKNVGGVKIGESSVASGKWERWVEAIGKVEAEVEGGESSEF